MPCTIGDRPRNQAKRVSDELAHTHNDADGKPSRTHLRHKWANDATHPLIRNIRKQTDKAEEYNQRECRTHRSTTELQYKVDLCKHKSVYRICRIALLCSSFAMAEQNYGFSQTAPSQGTENGILIAGEYLFWKTTEDQLEYAVRTASTVFMGGTTGQMFVKNQDFTWNSGVRVGVGYHQPCQRWGIDVNWTYLATTAHGQIHTSPNHLLVAPPLTGALTLMFGGGGPPEVRTADSRFHGKLNIFDLNVSRAIAFPKGFSLIPFLGAKGGWIDQQQRVIYTDLTHSVVMTPLPYARMTRNNDSAGIGPSVGLKTRWGKEFGVFGLAGAACLFSHLDAVVYYNFQGVIEDAEMKLEQNRLLLPMMQIQAGIDWTHVFSHRCSLSLRAAYESQVWWNQWRVANSPTAVVYAAVAEALGNLTFNGLTASVVVSF
jgi:hypothetical protein